MVSTGRILGPIVRGVLFILGGWQAGGVPEELQRDVGVDDVRQPRDRREAFWAGCRWFRGL